MFFPHNVRPPIREFFGLCIFILLLFLSIPPVCAESETLYGYCKSIGTNDNPAVAPYGGVARYVDPVKGENSGNGSITSPWADLEYALKTANAGDTIFLRDGIHNYAVHINGNVASKAESPIEVRSYPGEWAIIDGNGIGGGNIIRLINVSWIIFRNFEVRNSDPTRISSGIYAEMVSDSKFYNLLLRNNNGSGFSARKLFRSSFHNCTSTDNFDLQTDGNSADGFSITSGADNSFYRCIAIGNSDDGFDTWASVGNHFEDCIAADNGRGLLGNGMGFKLGKPDTSPNIESRGGGHTLIRCIALGNRFRGFSENSTDHGSRFIDCIAFDNAQNWELPNAPHYIERSVSLEGVDDRVGPATRVVSGRGGGFGNRVVEVADFESVALTDMNNTTQGNRFFHPLRPLF